MKKIITLLFCLPFISYAQLGCGSTFTDSGGSGGTYSSNENNTYYVCPTGGSDYVIVTFNSFDIESGYDYMSIFDGNGTSGTLLGQYTGTQAQGLTFTSSAGDGCLTFVFTSDGSVENAGWVASVTCNTSTPDPVDLNNVRGYNGNIENGFDYTIINNAERKIMTFGSKVANLTNSGSSGNTLGVTVMDGATTAYTGSTTFDINALDTQYVWISSNFTPLANKTYTVTLTLGNDLNNANNVKTFTFQTQADYYAHDSNPNVSVGSGATGTSYYFLNQFEVPNNGTIYSVDAKIAAGTTPNQTIRVFVGSFNNGFLGEGTKVITSADINNGQYVRVYLDNPVALDPTSVNYVGFGSELLNGTLNISAMANNDDNASLFLIDGTTTTTDKSFSVRMNFNQGCASFAATTGNIIAAQSCNVNSGEVSLTITTGGTSVAGQSTISWTGPETGSLSNQPNNATIGGLIPGNYLFTITNNGCSTTANASVTQTTSPSFTVSELTPISCNGQADGAIQYTSTGSTSGYNISWSNGATGTTLSNLSAGTYTLTAVNEACVITETFTLTEPAAIGISTTKTNVTACGGTNGVINITASGGTTSSYLYTWSGPSTGNSGPGFGNTFTINTLPAGNYTITVTNGSCMNSAIVSISEASAPVINVNVITAVSCNGDSNGTIKAVSSSNISAYTFTWSTGATGVTLNGVGAGTYSVIGTNGTCTTTGNIVVTEPDPILIEGAAGTSAINITVSGGNTSYSYAWTGPGGFSASTEDINNLQTTGNYTVTVTDNKGCTGTRTFNLQFLGIEDVEATSTAIKVYPNPASSVVNIEVSEEVQLIQLFDLSGKVLNEVAPIDGICHMNVADFADGMYLLTFITNENQVHHRQVVIRK